VSRNVRFLSAPQVILGIAVGISFGGDACSPLYFTGLRRGNDGMRVLLGLFGMVYAATIATVPFPGLSTSARTGFLADADWGGLVQNASVALVGPGSAARSDPLAARSSRERRALERRAPDG
jgi:hypothetical protein